MTKYSGVGTLRGRKLSVRAQSRNQGRDFGIEAGQAGAGQGGLGGRQRGGGGGQALGQPA